MATTFGVDLLFKANTSALDRVKGTLGSVEVTAKKLQSSIGSQLSTAFQRVGAAGAAAGAKIKAGFDRAIAGANALRAKLSGLGGLIASLGAGAAFGKAFSDASSLESAQARVQTLVKNYGQLTGIQKVAADAATKFRLSQTAALTDLVDLGNRLGSQGVTLEQLQNIYEGFNTLLANNKVGAQQAASAQLQLNQALGSGRLAGEEFNAINEATPQLLDEVARVLKVNRGELKQLGADGKITSAVLIQALTNIRTNGAADLESAFSGAFGATREFQAAISDFSAAIGTELLPAITPLIKGATDLLKAFGTLPGPVKTAAAGLLGLTAAAVALAPAISAVTSAVAALSGTAIAGALIAAGPWLAAAAGVAALGVALFNTNEDFRNLVNDSGKLLDVVASDAGDTASDVSTFFDTLAKDLKGKADYIQGVFEKMFPAVSSAGDKSASDLNNSFSSAFSRLVSNTQSALSTMSSLISGWFSNLPGPIKQLLGGNSAGLIAGGAQYLGGAAKRAQYKPYQSKFAGARDAAFAKAQLITGDPIRTFGGGGGSSSKSKGGGRSAKDDSERLAKEAEARRREIADLAAGNQLLIQQADLQNQIYNAKLAGSDEAEFDLEFQKRLLEGQAKIAEIKRNETDEVIRAQKVRTEELNTLAALRELTFDRQKLEQDRRNEIEDMVQELNDQTLLASTLNDEARKALELEQKIAKIRKENPWITDEQLEKLRSANQQLEAAEKKTAAIKAQQQQLENLYSGIAGEIAGGVGGAIDAVTGNVENLGEELKGLTADILKAVGKMLIFYALAQAFGALGGDDGVGVFSFLAKAFGGGRASGGPVLPNTTYLVGENGPELLSMGSSGGQVYSNSSDRTQSVMQRYNPANKGGAMAMAGGSSTERGGTALLDQPPQITINGGVMQFNDTNYIRQDQVPGIVDQASRAGEARALRKLQQSPTARRRIGM